jgi:glycosyltransferase involved in cell wall biosynthesis
MPSASMPATPPVTRAARRVLLVGDFAASRNGNFSVAEDLARRLAQRGFAVTTTSDRASRPWRVVDMWASTWRTRRSVDVAVIDVYSGRAFLWAEAVARLLQRVGVPFALVLRGGGLPIFARRQPERVRRLFGAAAAVVALSGYLAEQMSAYGGRVHVLPNPIDLAAYPYRQRALASPTLVWLRTFQDTYNPVMAVRVLARLREGFPDARLIMVGRDRGLLEPTRRAAAELGVRDHIEFVGPVAKAAVPKQLARGDLYLNTPRIDNVPISLLEAMACGLCVVSTDVGGIPYLVQRDREALLVADGDADAMAAGAARCLREPELAARLSDAGRRLAERHDWGEMLPRWETLLHGMADGGSR